MSDTTEFDFIWKPIKEILENQMSPIQFSTWIDKLVAVDIVEKKLVLQTSSEIFAKQISTRFSDTIKEAIIKANVGLNDFAIVIKGEEDYYFNGPNDDVLDDDISSQIDPRFTFDSFVVGKSNEWVFAAAKSVAENPGEQFNPLFIHGKTGLGKTHLLQAIANYILNKTPQKRVVYTTCEKFTNELIDVIFKSKKSHDRDITNQFKHRYRNVDVLIIDDIQFLANKQAAQEEFFHTFNELSSLKKQIVLSSDCHPKEMATLEERLKTRFAGGFIGDVQPPDIETKIAILRRKAMEKKFPMSDDVLEYLAKDSGNDVRTLEGRLNKVIFVSKLREEKISIDLAKIAIDEAVSEEQETISFDSVISAICGYYKIKKNDLIGKCKKKELVVPRQICCYLMCELLTAPLVSIGEAMGGRDHTTVIHSRDKISSLIKVNDRLNKDVNDIKNIILKQ